MSGNKSPVNNGNFNHVKTAAKSPEVKARSPDF